MGLESSRQLKRHKRSAPGAPDCFGALLGKNTLERKKLLARAINAMPHPPGEDRGGTFH